VCCHVGGRCTRLGAAWDFTDLTCVLCMCVCECVCVCVCVCAKQVSVCPDVYVHVCPYVYVHVCHAVCGCITQTALPLRKLPRGCASQRRSWSSPRQVPPRRVWLEAQGRLLCSGAVAPGSFHVCLWDFCVCWWDRHAFLVISITSHDPAAWSLQLPVNTASGCKVGVDSGFSGGSLGISTQGSTKPWHQGQYKVCRRGRRGAK